MRSNRRHDARGRRRHPWRRATCAAAALLLLFATSSISSSMIVVDAAANDDDDSKGGGRRWEDLCDARRLHDPPYDRHRPLASTERNAFLPFDDSTNGFTPAESLAPTDAPTEVPAETPSTTKPTETPTTLKPAWTPYPTKKPSTGKPTATPTKEPAADPTLKPTSSPTPKWTEWWERDPNAGDNNNNNGGGGDGGGDGTGDGGDRKPTLPPAIAENLDERGIPECPVDGYWFLHRITLTDKWGDGWEEVNLKLTDVGRNPFGGVSGGLDESDGAPVIRYLDTMKERDGETKISYLCLEAFQCYEVEVGTSQWDAEVGWEIHRVDRETLLPLDEEEDRVAWGNARVRCHFAVSRSKGMDDCAWSCTDEPPSPSVSPTPNPTSNPTVRPTDPPTDRPTLRPTDDPTPHPTPKPLPYPIPPTISPKPTISPRPTVSLRPTQARPSDGPTPRPQRSRPTPEPVLMLDAPLDYPPAPEGYYSYDVLDPHYGPLNWETFWPHCRAATRGEWLDFNQGGWVWNPDDEGPMFLDESQMTTKEIRQRNRAQVKSADDVNYDVQGYGGPQSPILIVPEIESDDVHSDATCEATHEIRTRSGEFSLCDYDTGAFSVTPSRLRVNFRGNAKPVANLPDGYGELDAETLDVTFPSLHTMQDPITGKIHRFDAEYTVFHPFVRQGKRVMVTVLINARIGGYNGRFQDLLDKWNEVDRCDSPSNRVGEWDCTPYNNKNSCEKALEAWEEEHNRPWGTRRRTMEEEEEEGKEEKIDAKGNDGKEEADIPRRELVEEEESTESTANLRSSAGLDVEKETKAEKKEHHQDGRKLSCLFNIYHKSLMPSSYFYAYAGSLPEPPCTPNTDWRVVDRPMTIGVEQLEQLKSLLTDGVCRDDPYGQNMGPVRARPVQESKGRPYWHCKRGDFPMDCERDNGYCDCDAILCPSDYDNYNV